MSNLQGPSQHMCFAGAMILEVLQIGVVEGNVPLQVGVLSYAGQLNFDIVADMNLVPASKYSRQAWRTICSD